MPRGASFAIAAAWLPLLFFATATTTILVGAAPVEDEIYKLPLWGRPPTTQYSGYLDASEGCEAALNGPVCKLHYWLALAPKSSKPDAPPRPTVLWLNGGPGASSLYGWFQELGPLLLNATGGLMENPWGWTNAGANVVALEAPMGVGFSYCSRQLERGEPCVNTDTNTAQASRAALVDFFKNKFPELVEGGFYIAGESYAGVYIPTLARELLTHLEAQQYVPLKGILVGDPCTDNDAQRDSMDSLWYSHKYGLVDNEVYDVLQSEACSEYLSRVLLRTMRRNEHRNTPPATTTAAEPPFGTHSSKSHRSIGKQWSSHATASELNQELVHIEDLDQRRRRAEELYRERVLGIVAEENTENRDHQNHEKNNNSENKNRHLRMASAAVNSDGNSSSNSNSINSGDDDDTKCKLSYRKYLISSSEHHSHSHDMFIDHYSLFAPTTTKEDEQMTDYFNRADVRAALHVTDTPDDPWARKKPNFTYQKEYKACNWRPPIKFANTTMVDIYREILPQLDRVWVYNGDTDPCVSYEGTREAIKQILAPELDGGSYRPWFYRQEAASLEVLAEKAVLFGPDLMAQTLEQAQFAGEVTSYEDGLTFATFHGSGHMVPQFRPQQSLWFLKRFLHAGSKEGEELSPLLPSNATLAKLDEDAFAAAMDAWTEDARAMADALY